MFCMPYVLRALTARPRDRTEHEGGRQQSFTIDEEQPVDRLAALLTTIG